LKPIFNTGSLGLEARLVEKAAEGTKLGRQVWKIDASHAGQGIDLRALFPWLLAAAGEYYGVDRDLRALFPWLLAAAGEYYGVDSGQAIVVRVREEDLAPAPPAENIVAP